MIIPDLNELVSLHDGVEIFVKTICLKIRKKKPNHLNMIRVGEKVYKFADINLQIKSSSLHCHLLLPYSH